MTARARSTCLVVLSLALFCLGSVEGAQRKVQGPYKFCKFNWDTRQFKVATSSDAHIGWNDAWAPRGGRIILSRNCQFWVNANCTIVQEIGGCDDGNGCTVEKCVTPDTRTCKPFPACAFQAPMCTYRKTCNNRGTKRNTGVLLTGRIKMPGPKNACKFNPITKRYYLQKWAFWRRLATQDAWAPGPGRLTRSGDCKVSLDDKCRPVSKSGGCSGGKGCTQNTCQWSGNKNWPMSCQPWPTCFFKGAQCKSKNTCDGGPSPPKTGGSGGGGDTKGGNSGGSSGGSQGGSAGNDGGGDSEGGQVFNVRDFGAKGDGNTNDRDAIAKAFYAACEASRKSGKRATVLLEKGRTFLTKPLNLDSGGEKPGRKASRCGPGLIFQLDGTLLGTKSFEDYKSARTPALLEFQNVDGLQVQGKGSLDGQGEDWWKNGMALSRPQGLLIRYCNGVTVKGISIINPGQMHLFFYACKNVKVLGIYTKSPAESPNTDSIHFDDVQHAVIKDCVLGGGDDGVSFVAGTRDVLVEDTTAHNTHGFSIGSIGRGCATGCVSDIVFRNLKIKDALYGARIKTYQCGKGCVNNITYSNIEMENVWIPIVLDQFYCNGNHGSACGVDDDGVAISNVLFDNIWGTGGKNYGVQIQCSYAAPCTNIRLRDIDLQPAGGFSFTPAVQNALLSMSGTIKPSLPDSTISGLKDWQRSKIDSMQNTCKAQGIF